MCIHKFPKLIFAVIASMLWVLPVSEAQKVDLSALPFPLVPAKEAGDYFEHLEEMRNLLEKGDGVEFYSSAQALTEKIDGNRALRRILQKPIDTKEDTIALEWWTYYLAIAPLISEEELKKTSDPEKFSEFDVGLKRRALGTLTARKVDVYGELLKQDPKKLNALYLRHAQFVMRTLQEGRKLWAKIYQFERKHLEELEKIPERREKDEYDYQVTMRMHARSLPSKIAYRRNDEFRFVIGDTEKAYVKKIIASFPKDGPEVQKFILNSGYDTKEACRDLLLRTVRRDKDKEYLFQGLPELKKENTPKRLASPKAK